MPPINEKKLFGFFENRIFLISNEMKEDNCVEFLMNLVQDPLRTAPINKKKLSAVLEKFNPILTANQRSAIEHVNSHNFTAILGPEGSGKKTVLGVLLDVLRKNHPRSQIEVLSTNDQHDLREEIANCGVRFSAEIGDLSHSSLSFNTMRRFLDPTATKKRQSKPPNILIIFGSERISLETWNRIATSSRLFSLTKLILIGDLNLEFLGKTHLLWNMLASGKTKACTVQLQYDYSKPSEIVGSYRSILEGQAIKEVPGCMELRYLGRDQSAWRSAIQDFISNCKAEDTIIFAPNRKYKAKLDRLCQLTWNKQEVDIECSLVRSGEVTLPPAYNSRALSITTGTSESIDHDLFEEDANKEKRSEDRERERVRVEFNAERRVKTIRLRDRIISLPALPHDLNTFG